MKSFIYLIFFVFTSCQSKSQNRKEFKSISLADEVLVGKLQYNKFNGFFINYKVKAKSLTPCFAFYDKKQVKYIKL